MKMTKKIQMVLAVIVATGVVAGALLTACSTSQTTAAYKGEVATQTAVAAAMTGWGVYVGMYHPGTNEEQKVFDAFQIYKQSELLLIDSTASLANNPTNTTTSQAALNAVAAAQLDLLNLITSLTNGSPWTNTVR
jgi:hypothetical protein